MQIFFATDQAGPDQTGLLKHHFQLSAEAEPADNVMHLLTAGATLRIVFVDAVLRFQTDLIYSAYAPPAHRSSQISVDFFHTCHTITRYSIEKFHFANICLIQPSYSLFCILNSLTPQNSNVKCVIAISKKYIKDPLNFH